MINNENTITNIDDGTYTAMRRRYSSVLRRSVSIASASRSACVIGAAVSSRRHRSSSVVVVVVHRDGGGVASVACNSLCE
jgi:hypothetical protein